MATADCSRETEREREREKVFPRCCLAVSLLFYVLSVFRLTCLIARARTSSSTHQLAKCQHTLKLRYEAKRKSQPLILYHFCYMRSGRIDADDNQVCNSTETTPSLFPCATPFSSTFSTLRQRCWRCVRARLWNHCFPLTQVHFKGKRIRYNYILIWERHLIGRKEKRKMPSGWCRYSFARKETNDNDCQVIRRQRVCTRARVFPRASRQEINNLSDDDDESPLPMIVGRTSE